MGRTKDAWQILARGSFAGLRSRGGGQGQDTWSRGEQGRRALASESILHGQGPHEIVSEGFRTVSGAVAQRASVAPEAQPQSHPWPGWPVHQPCSPAVREVTLPIWVSTANRSWDRKKTYVVPHSRALWVPPPPRLYSLRDPWTRPGLRAAMVMATQYSREWPERLDSNPSAVTTC